MWDLSEEGLLQTGTQIVRKDLVYVDVGWMGVCTHENW